MGMGSAGAGNGRGPRTPSEIHQPAASFYSPVTLRSTGQNAFWAPVTAWPRSCFAPRGSGGGAGRPSPSRPGAGQGPCEGTAETRRRNNDGKQPDCVHLELQTAQDNQHVAFSGHKLFSQRETLYHSLLKPLTPRRLSPARLPDPCPLRALLSRTGQGERSRPCLP